MRNADTRTDAMHLDWGHLPAAALQTLGRHCCPASKAKLRLVCRTWHNALAAKFKDVYIGPGSPWPAIEDEELEDDAATDQHVTAVQRCYPAATTLHVTASSTRDYPASYTQDLAQLMCGLPGLVNLSLQELHELEDFDNLDLASLWDALEAAAPCLGQRLVGLNVSDCFWNDPELFGVLRHLTALTQLRLANNPLEAVCEVGIIASMSQLRVLEFGLIYDGASQHHDVPRALEAIGNLQQLEELSLPMWRRSLGGRAHPLAPALSAALGRLTQLTSLAVDGKFGHLRVVSSLTNLQRLASAAPMSVEGWESIAKLPQLTLLTSLTPPGEPLSLHPTRPHSGLDLALLATKGSLAGLDVGVMQPEHLATLGQFTRLERLNLRCVDTFQQPQQQEQLLTALSCLPGSLTSLHLGPLLPLSAKLLSTIARSCPRLKALHASFAHVAAAVPEHQTDGTEDGGGAAAAAALSGVLTSAASNDSDSLAAVDADMEDVEPKAELAVAQALQHGAACAAAVALAALPAGSWGVSRALSKLRELQCLELVLLWHDEHGDRVELCQASSSSGHSAAGKVGLMAAGAAVPVPGGFAQPCVQLALEDLPGQLEQLVLTGPWQLCERTSYAATAEGSHALLHKRHSNLPGSHSKPSHQHCVVCGGAAAPKATAAGQSAALPVQQLCECTQGMKLASPASSGWASPQPGQETTSLAAAVAHAHQQLAIGSAAGSATCAGRPTSGQKRPGLHTVVLAAAAADDASAANSSGMDSGEDAAAADVFVLEHSRGLEKRSRSFSGPISQLEQDTAVPGTVVHGPASANQDAQDAALAQQQQLPLPVLLELCLFGCHISCEALAQLVATAGVKLRKLQLLQLYTNPPTTVHTNNVSGQRMNQPLGIITEGVVMQPAAAVQQPAASAAQSLPGRVMAWQNPAEMTTQQLVLLPVAWSCLQEWHLHPHQLWGLVRAGCFGAAGKVSTPRGAAADSTEDSSSSSSSNCMHHQRQLPRRWQHVGGSGLHHVSQLLNLRHLHVVNRPAAFGATYPSVKERRPGEAVTCLPLHDRQSMQMLLHQLQAGLQELPALRQLLLYMGHVAKEQPALHDACADVWTEAGERLLEVMPACKVKHYKPTVVGMAEVAGLAAVVAQAAAAAGGSVEGAIDFDYII